MWRVYGDLWRGVKYLFPCFQRFHLFVLEDEILDIGTVFIKIIMPYSLAHNINVSSVILEPRREISAGK